MLLIVVMVNGPKRENDDPPGLRGLEQAVFVLEEICGSERKSELIRRMRGDKQLVDMWMNFLQYNHVISYDKSVGEWMLTEKGRRWIKRIRAVLPQLYGLVRLPVDFGHFCLLFRNFDIAFCGASVFLARQFLFKVLPPVLRGSQDRAAYKALKVGRYLFRFAHVLLRA